MLKKEEFDKMPHNPFAAPKRMLETYDRLRRIDAFSELVDLHTGDKSRSALLNEEMLDQMIRFVVLYVEPKNNPLAKESDLEERAKSAWRLLGVGDKNLLVHLNREQHWWSTKMIFEYFRLTNGTNYQHWFALKSGFLASSKILIQGAEGDPESSTEAKQKASKFIDTNIQKIQTLEALLFPNSNFMDEITVESLFSNRIPEMNALSWSTKTTRL